MGTWSLGAGVVELPDGTRIRGAGLRRPRPSAEQPDFAIYLIARDPGRQPWEHRWVRWPDFRVPRSSSDAVVALSEAYRRGRTERVEIACGAGVGRTGTALALIAVMVGVPADEAVGWIREHYHPRAVETPWQRRWIGTAAGMLGAG